MNRSHGYTVVELLVASAVMLVALAGITGAIHAAILRVPWLEESTELQQRTRAAVESMASELRAAGAGELAGPLAGRFASVLPRHAAAAPAVASNAVVTIRYAPVDAAVASLAAPLLTADPIATLTSGGVCPVTTVACGFTAGTFAVVFDAAGQADLLSVTTIAPSTLAVGPVHGPRAGAYAAGDTILELIEVTYSLDAASRTLRREEGGVVMPLVDHVTSLSFGYLGVAARPTEPRPPLGTANCLYAADGTYLHALVGGTALGPISTAELADGPFCGAGDQMYDVDLLRIRAVQVHLRLETGADMLRGTNPVWFSRPGTATDSRVIHDADLAFTVSLRNLGR